MNRTVKASEFKAKCLALLDEVAASGSRLVITKSGRPVADVVPHQVAKTNPLGLLKGELKITGDIVSPVKIKWDAMK